MRADTLDDLKGDRKTTPANKHSRSFNDLLLSPVLRNILCNPINFREGRSSIVGRIDRAELGDHDART